MTMRFVLRPDREGFTVQDVWTGDPAVIAMTPQTGLSEEDATHTAELLNGAPFRATAACDSRGSPPRDGTFCMITGATVRSRFKCEMRET